MISAPRTRFAVQVGGVLTANPRRLRLDRNSWLVYCSSAARTSRAPPVVPVSIRLQAPAARRPPAAAEAAAGEPLHDADRPRGGNSRGTPCIGRNVGEAGWLRIASNARSRLGLSACGFEVSEPSSPIRHRICRLPSSSTLASYGKRSANSPRTRPASCTSQPSTLKAILLSSLVPVLCSSLSASSLTDADPPDDDISLAKALVEMEA